MATATITPTVRSELIAIFMDAQEQHEREARFNRAVFPRVCREFEGEMKRYDYVEVQKYPDINGNLLTRSMPRPMCSNIQSAFSTLLRAVYQVNSASKLPASAEPEMREFVRGVLDLMEKYRPPVEERSEAKKDVLPGATNT